MSAYGMNLAGLGVPSFAVPDADDDIVPSVPVHTQLMAVTTLVRPSDVGLTMNWGNVQVKFISVIQPTVEDPRRLFL